jgi:hypothetical protein
VCLWAKTGGANNCTNVRHALTVSVNPVRIRGNNSQQNSIRAGSTWFLLSVAGWSHYTRCIEASADKVIKSFGRMALRSGGGTDMNHQDLLRRGPRLASGAIAVVAGPLIALFALTCSAAALDLDIRAKTKTQSARGWVCNAYGRTRAWQTFTGSIKSSRELAERSALEDCRKKAFACRLSGCWPE